MHPGANQQITVIFIASEYKEFNTTLKIISQKDVLNIPIEAYPVISQEDAKLFPKIIDFGIC